MSSFKIEVYDNTGQMVQALEAAVRGVSNWSAFWSDKNGVISKAWAKSRKEMFYTQGASTGSPWPPYTKEEKKYCYYYFRVMP